MGGRVLPGGQIKIANLSEFGAATVFTQQTSTTHLLAVPFDARKKSAKNRGGWRPITFDHTRVGKSNNYFSSISTIGSEEKICAKGPPHWIPELLDPHYGGSDSGKIQLGMIGDLPLLFALAAFAAPRKASLFTVLQQCLQPGAWRPHGIPPESTHRCKVGRFCSASALTVYRYCGAWHGGYRIS